MSVRTLPTVVLMLLAGAFSGLAVIGGIRSHTPVPFWDMWNGYLEFYTDLATIGPSAFFEQNNEHRVILSKLLFYIDLTYFAGLSQFLMVSYYLIALAAVYVFWCFTKGLPSTDRLVFVLVAACLVFFWSQRENFIWAYQSQFLLAQLVPLIGFYFLWRSDVSGRPIVLFLMALCFGVLSAGTMANGILALPVMAMYAAFVRAPGWQTLVLAIAAVSVIAGYYTGYETTEADGYLGRNLIEMPVQMLDYILLYFGSPAFYAVSGSDHKMLVARLAGAAVLSAGLLLTGVTVFWRRDARAAAISGFMAYLGVSACAVAIGRVFLGPETAVASRYSTPAVFFWISTILLVFSSLPMGPARARRILQAAMVMLCLSLLPEQFKALERPDARKFREYVATLALAYQINDERNIKRIYPIPEHALDLAKIPSESGLSVFGLPEFKNAQNELGQDYLFDTTVAMQTGMVEQISRVDAGGQLVRILVPAPAAAEAPPFLTAVGEDGRVAGRLLHDFSRPAQDDRFAYEGYLIGAEPGEEIRFVGETETASIAASVQLPAVLFEVLPFVNADAVSAVAVLENDGWTGKDFFRTELEGIRVLGTFVQSDADTGHLSLMLQQGDTIMFRTGPSAAGLQVTIDGFEPVALPQSPDWVLLRFSNPDLPQGFTATLSDTGQGWGQWAAIGIAE